MPWAEGGEGGIRDPFNDITALVSCTQRERAAGMMSLAGWLWERCRQGFFN